jgi:hypothetical protein
MLFFFFTLSWIVLAKEPEHFAFPAIAIAIRACYLSKGIRFSPVVTALIVLFIFLFTWHGDSLQAGITASLRIFLIVVLFGHIVLCPTSRLLAFILSLEQMKWLAYFFHYLKRFFSILLIRFSDIQYAVSSQIKSSESKFIDKLGIWARGCLSIFLETEHIIDQVVLVLQSRGECKPTSFWKPLPPPNHSILLGDCIIWGGLVCLGCTIPQFILFNIPYLL